MTSANDFDWNESAILRLRDLWAEGHSAAQIGRMLGCSKNAVIGKSCRLDLPRRPSPVISRSQTPDAIRRRAYRQREPHAPGAAKTLPALPSLAPRAARSPFPPPTPAIILPPNLCSRCCYVVDDTRMQQRYCDAPAPLGSSWCVEHARQVFAPDHFPDWCAKHHVRPAPAESIAA